MRTICQMRSADLDIWGIPRYFLNKKWKLKYFNLQINYTKIAGMYCKKKRLKYSVLTENQNVCILMNGETEKE